MRMSKRKLTKQKQRLKKIYNRKDLGAARAAESLTSFIANAKRGNSYFKIRQMLKYFKTLTGSELHGTKLQKAKTGRGAQRGDSTVSH